MNQIKRTEFGIITGIFLLLLFTLLYKGVADNVFDLQHEYGYKFMRYHQVFDYYKHYLLPVLAHITIVYFSFVLVHFLIVPRYYEKQRWLIGGLFSLPVILALFLTIWVANTWYYGYLFGVYKTVQGVHTHCAKSAFILTWFYVVLYLLYYAVRYLFLKYIYSNMVNKPWFRQFAIDLFVILVGTIVCTNLVTGWRHNDIMVMTFFICLFEGFLYFAALYRLFPSFLQHRNRKTLIKETAIVLAFAFVWMIIPASHADHEPGGFYLASLFFVWAGGIIVVLPVSWWIYTIRNERATTIYGLQKALDHSEAGLDFLRWQINPHFLFNALNTLYGTALLEHATATGQGIQQLGDMMRFMLHDNTLEAIPLSKEIAYLQNYIALQRLRTQGTPDINIEVNIDDARCDHDIAPMLLIPFVENAFKYGISLRNKSRINVSLSCTEQKIFFDVYNTVHANRSAEVEQESMGIGLNNVRQRLNLLYPKRHELNIRETGSEFFVHLTLEINENVESNRY